MYLLQFFNRTKISTMTYTKLKLSETVRDVEEVKSVYTTFSEEMFTGVSSENVYTDIIYFTKMCQTVSDFKIQSLQILVCLGFLSEFP